MSTTNGHVVVSSPCVSRQPLRISILLFTESRRNRYDCQFAVLIRPDIELDYLVPIMRVIFRVNSI